MIRVGIIGCGSIARQRHAAEYNKNPNVEIIGYYDALTQRAESLAEKFGGRVFKSCEELLACEEIDAVSVCVANNAHAKMSILAMEAGKHVLCEKPMAVTLEDCEAMIACSRKTGKKLMIGHNQRFTDAHVAVKKLLDSGDLGRIISFSTEFGHAGPEMWSADKSANTWFFQKDKAALGSMADLGVHKIDLIRFFVGKKVEQVYAMLSTLDKKFEDGTPIEVDDNAACVIKFKDGPVGTVTTSWTHYGEECNSTMLYCENGIVKIYAHPDYPVEIVYKNKNKVYYEMDSIQTNEEAEQKSSGVIDAFIDSILHDTEPPVSGEEALESMKVVFACIKSNETGKPCALD